MDKDELIKMKKSLLAIGMAGVMLGSSGCSTHIDGQNSFKKIPQDHSRVNDYKKEIVRDGNVVTVYKAENVLILYDKETYELEEYLYCDTNHFGFEIELYNLESEEMLVWSNGISTTYNRDYYNYLKENNYQIFISNAFCYVEDCEIKEYYSLEEIKNLEIQILDRLKNIHNVKYKTKIK